METFTILQDRQCGSCSLCCKLLPIVKNDLFDFEKAAGLWCSHFKPGVGCNIHTTRPQGCRNYKCEWLKGNLSAELKPDVVNFIVERRRVENLDYMLVLWDSAWVVVRSTWNCSVSRKTSCPITADVIKWQGFGEDSDLTFPMGETSVAVDLIQGPLRSRCLFPLDHETGAPSECACFDFHNK